MPQVTPPPERGISINLGDEIRRLRFDINALIELEDALGVDLMKNPESIVALFEEPTLRNIRTLLWAGLLHESPTLTVRDAGAFIDTENMNTIGAAMRGVFFGNLPEATEGTGGEEKKE